MSDSMVERVAVAMFEAGWPHEHQRKEHLQHNPNAMDGYRRLARAAIKAMREPTEEMRVAAMERPDTEEFIEELYSGIWKAMIDGALKDE